MYNRRVRHLNPATAGAAGSLYARSITGLSPGASVSAWSSLRPATYDITQGTGALQPTWESPVQGGQPGVRSTTSQYLGGASTIAIMTVIWAHIWNDGNTAGYNFQFGQVSNFEWHGTPGTALLDPSFSSANIRGGSGWVNGASLSPASMVKATSASVYSIITLAQIATDEFAADRVNSFGARSFIGDYYAIAMWVAAISDALRRRIEQHMGYYFRIKAA